MFKQYFTMPRVAPCGDAAFVAEYHRSLQEMRDAGAAIDDEETAQWTRGQRRRRGRAAAALAAEFAAMWRPARSAIVDYVLRAKKNDPEDPQCIADDNAKLAVPQNVVATVQLCEVPGSLALSLHGVASCVAAAKQCPPRFAALIVRFVDPRGVMLVFASLKVVIVGATSLHAVYLCVQMLRKQLRIAGVTHDASNICIRNVVCNVRTRHPINIEALRYAEQNGMSTRRSSFPGYVLVVDGTYVLVFRTGDVIMMGQPVYGHEQEVLAKVRERLRRYYYISDANSAPAPASKFVSRSQKSFKTLLQAHGRSVATIQQGELRHVLDSLGHQAVLQTLTDFVHDVITTHADAATRRALYMLRRIDRMFCDVEAARASDHIAVEMSTAVVVLDPDKPKRVRFMSRDCYELVQLVLWVLPHWDAAASAPAAARGRAQSRNAQHLFHEITRQRDDSSDATNQLAVWARLFALLVEYNRLPSTTPLTHGRPHTPEEHDRFYMAPDACVALPRDDAAPAVSTHGVSMPRKALTTLARAPLLQHLREMAARAARRAELDDGFFYEQGTAADVAYTHAGALDGALPCDTAPAGELPFLREHARLLAADFEAFASQLPEALNITAGVFMTKGMDAYASAIVHTLSLLAVDTARDAVLANSSAHLTEQTMLSLFAATLDGARHDGSWPLTPVMLAAGATDVQLVRAMVAFVADALRARAMWPGRLLQKAALYKFVLLLFYRLISAPRLDDDDDDDAPPDGDEDSAERFAARLCGGSGDDALQQQRSVVAELTTFCEHFAFTMPTALAPNDRTVADVDAVMTAPKAPARQRRDTQTASE